MLKKTLLILLVMTSLISFCACAQNVAPKDKLTYCSYSCSRPAGGGKDYCELIADSGAVPKVVVSLYNDCRWHEHIEKEYTVGPQDVAKMQKMLAEMEVYKLNGYTHDEQLDGAPTYRIYQEYASGERINAVWSGHDIKEDAVDAYHYIKNYFSLWREMVDDRA